jgi:hypothetical protein
VVMTIEMMMVMMMATMNWMNHRHYHNDPQNELRSAIAFKQVRGHKYIKNKSKI